MDRARVKILQDEMRSLLEGLHLSVIPRSVSVLWVVEPQVPTVKPYSLASPQNKLVCSEGLMGSSIIGVNWTGDRDSIGFGAHGSCLLQGIHSSISVRYCHLAYALRV